MFGIDKRRNRRRQEPRRWRLPAIDWRALAVSVASLGGLLAVAAAVGWALDQPIQRVVVQGRFQRVSPLDVEQAVKRQLRGAGLVSVNLPAVRHAIESLPWVDTATVARAWPRGLQVMVTEQIAAARWGTNGLLNSRGELFDSESRHIPPELPRLSGPPGSEHEVAQRYLASQGRLVEAGMHIAALRLDARGAWQIDLDNGVMWSAVDPEFSTARNKAVEAGRVINCIAFGPNSQWLMVATTPQANTRLARPNDATYTQPARATSQVQYSPPQNVQVSPSDSQDGAQASAEEARVAELSAKAEELQDQAKEAEDDAERADRRADDARESAENYDRQAERADNDLVRVTAENIAKDFRRDQERFEREASDARKESQRLREKAEQLEAEAEGGKQAAARIRAQQSAARREAAVQRQSGERADSTPSTPQSPSGGTTIQQELEKQLEAIRRASQGGQGTQGAQGSGGNGQSSGSGGIAAEPKKPKTKRVLVKVEKHGDFACTAWGSDKAFINTPGNAWLRGKNGQGTLGKCSTISLTNGSKYEITFGIQGEVHTVGPKSDKLINRPQANWENDREAFSLTWYEDEWQEVPGND